VVGLLLARVLAVFLLLHSGVEDEHSILGGDARRYEVINSSEGTPYADFEVEYPPLTLGVIELVHAPSLLGTLTRLAISQLVLDVAVAGLLGWGWGRRTAVWYLVLGTPMLAFPFPYVRIDLLSVYLAMLGLVLVRKGGERLGGVALAAAVFAKLWPLAVAPVLLVERKLKGLAAWAVTGAVAVAAWVAWAGVAGIGQVATFRGARGWQIESLPGVFVHMADPSGSHVEQGAWRTAAEVPGWGRPLLTLASVAVITVAWWLAARRRAEGADDHIVYGLAPLAAVLALLIFSPIISPQYVLWLMPFGAVLAARGDRWVGGLMLVTTALTTLILALIHAQIEGRLHATLPIVARNGVLVALLVLTLVRLARPVGAQPAPDRPAQTQPA